MKTTNLQNMILKHRDFCGIKVYSNPDRKCTCGRDEAEKELAALQARIKRIDDEYLNVIETCNDCIQESLHTEMLEKKRGLNPIQRLEHRHAYEKIKTIFQERLRMAQTDPINTSGQVQP